MSLTSIISGKPFQELRTRFKEVFPRPKFNLKSELIAPPLTTNHSIVGQAFDYLLRFQLEHKYKDKVISDGAWVADSAFNGITRKLKNTKQKEIQVGFRRDIPKNRVQFLNLINEEFQNAKSNYNVFLKNGIITDGLLKSCLFLARLDVTVRAGMIDPNLGNENVDDVADLKNIFEIVNPDYFEVKKYCYINPTFGKGSMLVGGADADLIIDGSLIEIKVTKHLELDREHLNQLIGYYLLSLIGGVNDNPNLAPINNLGVYYARHGALWKVQICDLCSENALDEFCSWFHDYIDAMIHGGRFKARYEAWEKSVLNEMEKDKPKPKKKVRASKKPSVKKKVLKTKKKVITKKAKKKVIKITKRMKQK